MAGSFATESLTQITIFSIKGVIDKLMSLSFQIRKPTMRFGFSSAKSYREIDPETGVDLIKEFSSADLQHVTEFIADCRKARDVPPENLTDQPLSQRLANANTARRQQLRKWRHHRIKMQTLNESTATGKPTIDQPPLKLILEGGGRGQRNAISMPTTATEAPKISDVEEIKSHISISTVVRLSQDPQGHEINYPKLPGSFESRTEFECPYCCVLCPGRWSTGEAWRQVSSSL